MAATPTMVYPIPGRIAVGVPMIEQELPTKAEAEALIASTGAFALSAKEAAAAAYSTPEATEATDANVKPRRDPDAAPAPTEVEPTPVAPGPDPEDGGESSQTQADRAPATADEVTDAS